MASVQLPAPVARGSLVGMVLVVLAVAALLDGSTASAAGRPPARPARPAPPPRAAPAAGRAPAPPARPAPPPRPAQPGKWTRPFPLTRPLSGDVLPAQIVFSPSGEATVAFGLYNIDFPERSEALISVRAPNGKLSRPRRVPNAQEVLALAYDGTALELLAGTSPSEFPCCSSARALTFTGGAFRHVRTLLSSLDGAALGALVALPATHMLAAIASGAGAWVAQSTAVGRFRSPHALTSSSVSPQTVAGAGLKNGHSGVAWTQTASAQSNVPATGIFLATGSATRAPRAGRLMLSLPAGHGIDELALAGGTAGATAAWTESWFDRFGTYHAEVAVADLLGRVRARTFEVRGQLASGVTLAADAKGDQVLAWKSCDALGLCSVRAVSRAAGRRFGVAQRLGTIDTGEDPAAAVAPDGEALVGWSAGGRVLVADRRGAGGRFGRPHTVSGIPGASAVAVAFGPSDQALVAWTQGVAAPSVFAAFRP